MLKKLKIRRDCMYMVKGTSILVKVLERVGCISCVREAVDSTNRGPFWVENINLEDYISTNTKPLEWKEFDVVVDNVKYHISRNMHGTLFIRQEDEEDSILMKTLSLEDYGNRTRVAAIKGWVVEYIREMNKEKLYGKSNNTNNN